MQQYTDFCGSFSLQNCKKCHETWPTDSVNSGSLCSKCKTNPKKFSADNNQIPSDVAVQLQDLQMAEKLLIVRVIPIMEVYSRPGG